MDIIQVITQELKVEKWQVEAAVKLIDEGNTIPFISRYRKESTIDTFCPEKVLINEDFPLLVLPKIPICRRFPEGVSFNVTAILIPSFRCCY